MIPADAGLSPRIAIIGAASSLGAMLVTAFPDSSIPVLRASAGLANEVIVSDYKDLSPSDIGGCTHVVNCVGVTKVSADVLRRVNVDLVAHLIEVSKAVGALHFLQISSFSVYGNIRHIDRSSAACPINDYGRSKLAAEQLLIDASSANFAMAILRLPAIFGAGGVDKLMSLCQRWLSLGAFVKPRADVRRSMISAAAASQVIVELLMSRRQGTFLAADPMPFSYGLALRAMRTSGFPGLRLFVLPAPLPAVLGVTLPALARSLLTDCYLIGDDNVVVDLGVRSDIASFIAQIASQRAGRN